LTRGILSAHPAEKSASCREVWVLESQWVLRKGIMVDDGGLFIMECLAKKPLLRAKVEINDTVIVISG